MKLGLLVVWQHEKATEMLLTMTGFTMIIGKGEQEVRDYFQTP